MKTLTLIFLVAFPVVSWADGCWNPNTQRWQWCPPNPYQDSSNNLYGAGASMARANAQAANNMAWQRLEEQRSIAESGEAAKQRILARQRRLEEMKRRRYSSEDDQ